MFNLLNNKKMVQFSENFEVESRKVEFGVPVEMLGSDLTAKDLAPETFKNENLSFDFDIKSCHVSVREGFPF